MGREDVAPSLTRTLFEMGLALFLVTVAMGAVIGIQGLHMAQLSDPVLHTHLHSGTLGWITLASLGAGIWMLAAGRPEARRLSWVAGLVAVGVVLQLLTFYLDSAVGMVFAGALTTLGVLVFFGWAVAQQRGQQLTVPTFGLLLGLVSFVVGGAIGVVVAMSKAGWIGAVPDGIAETHPTGMITGYLVPLAMGLVEWRVSDGEARHRRYGFVQMGLVFAGFVVLVVASATGQMNIGGTSALLSIIAVAIFAWRVGPDAVRAWKAGPARRFEAVAALGLPVYVALLVVLIAIAVQQGRAAVPDGLLAGMDHVLFIGVMTNVLFGIVAESVRERREVWAGADLAMLLLANAGLVVFVASLAAGFDLGESVGAPLMGAGLAACIVVLLRRLTIGTRPSLQVGTRPTAPMPR